MEKGIQIRSRPLLKQFITNVKIIRNPRFFSLAGVLMELRESMPLTLLQEVKV